ncbi:protein translocase subunit SecF [Hyphomicrobium sp. NDB2Meth4]|uniref:protein translocase subunit SecF n=1 Tax=Hyphomicrobium sp. NDB2Meth4 TaxID=1892846 RepID=UPI0009F94C2E|nr:protein translocase subunit SecF [Hyphomicrobium sp. NDB2Meth4]
MFFPVPDFKGFDFFPHNLRIPFMRYKGLCFVLSVMFMAGSLGLYFTKGLNYGVDFVGGSLIEVQHKNGPAPLSEMREKLNALGIGSVQIQSFGSDTDVLIRVEQQKGGESEQQVAMKKVIDTLGPEYTQRRIEVVGPAVSSELRRTGLIAVFASIIAIIIYVWFRFEWQFAAGTVVALLHDVLVTVGVFSLLGLEFDLSIVAALLTILGYSVNDSVVVSDRIRENLRKFKRMDLNELLNISINETLSRTILTGMTAIAGIMALLVFGGEVIRNFSFAMLFGIIIGTYSSMFIAAPLLGYLGVKRDTVGSAPKPADAGPVIAPATPAGADRAKKAARGGGRQVPNKAAR